MEERLERDQEPLFCACKTSLKSQAVGVRNSLFQWLDFEKLLERSVRSSSSLARQIVKTDRINGRHNFVLWYFLGQQWGVLQRLLKIAVHFAMGWAFVIILRLLTCWVNLPNCKKRTCSSSSLSFGSIHKLGQSGSKINS